MRPFVKKDTLSADNASGDEKFLLDITVILPITRTFHSKVRVRSCCVHIPDPNGLEDRRMLGNPELFLSEMLSIFLYKNLARILIPKPASLSSRSRIACLDFQQHIFSCHFCGTIPLEHVSKRLLADTIK